MKTKLMLAAGAALAALSLSAPAQAETINVSGYVNQYCALTPGTTNIAFGNLGAQGVASTFNVNYSLYCNVGFDTSVSSLNGRLLNGNVSSGNIAADGSSATANRYTPDTTGTFYAALDYTLTSGSSTLSSADFTPGTIAPLTTSNAPTNLSVPVSFNIVPLTGTQQLTAGPYNDTLTITITPTGL
ncbi:MAG TPA: spore coat protein U domain-containing protein [Vitreimonas sp.]|nr:spore coat protein U domain-containing protein [Vitreimonas sp.]